MAAQSQTVGLPTLCVCARACMRDRGGGISLPQNYFEEPIFFCSLQSTYNEYTMELLNEFQ